MAETKGYGAQWRMQVEVQKAQCKGHDWRRKATGLISGRLDRFLAEQIANFTAALVAVDAEQHELKFFQLTQDVLEIPVIMPMRFCCIFQHVSKEGAPKSSDAFPRASDLGNQNLVLL